MCLMEPSERLEQRCDRAADHHPDGHLPTNQVRDLADRLSECFDRRQNSFDITMPTAPCSPDRQFRETACTSGFSLMRRSLGGVRIADMDIAALWARLSEESRDWLIEHNGESLAPSIRAEILTVTAGHLQPSWWNGEAVDGQSELTDEAVDWIETFANGEKPADTR